MRKIGRYLIETPRNREKPITTVIFTSRKLPNHKLLKTMLAPQHPSIPHTFDVGVEIQFPRMQGVNLVISVSIATHWTAIRSWWCSLFYNDDHRKKIVALADLQDQGCAGLPEGIYCFAADLHLCSPFDRFTIVQSSQRGVLPRALLSPPTFRFRRLPNWLR